MKKNYITPEITTVVFKSERGYASSMQDPDPIAQINQQIELFNESIEDKSVQEYGVSTAANWGGDFSDGFGWSTDDNHFWGN